MATIAPAEAGGKPVGERAEWECSGVGWGGLRLKLGDRASPLKEVEPEGGEPVDRQDADG
ncbi:hypothetical protein GCM10025760_33060 [Microbacterium yannicii]|uniref:Uncharacterized protein n=1 Tax=Microbacterium yannicii TaxID=671622 RepID=A0ABP9MPD9_9MICO